MAIKINGSDIINNDRDIVNPGDITDVDNIGVGTDNFTNDPTDASSGTIVSGTIRTKQLFVDGNDLVDGNGFINVDVAKKLTSDADGNLFGGTNAGGDYDPASNNACFNTFFGDNAGCNITQGDANIFIGLNAGFCNLT